MESKIDMSRSFGYCYSRVALKQLSCSLSARGRRCLAGAKPNYARLHYSWCTLFLSHVYYVAARFFDKAIPLLGVLPEMVGD